MILAATAGHSKIDPASYFWFSSAAALVRAGFVEVEHNYWTEQGFRSSRRMYKQNDQSAVLRHGVQGHGDEGMD